MLRYVTGLDQVPAGLAQLQRRQTALERLASQDDLTGALNARAFEERLAQQLIRTRRCNLPLALLCIDLDAFKAVNDRHSHRTGDAVLRLVANATRPAVRQSDIVGRLGADAFAVLMPETEGGVAEAAATRLANGIRTVFRGAPSVTASIGLVSTVHAATTRAEELLRRADQAMYEAKRTGKDRVVQVAL